MSHTTREIPREAWRPYFDEFSKYIDMVDATVEATVEVIGADIGARVEADHLVLTGIVYDDRDDVVVIGLDAPGDPPGDLERMVEHPERIRVATAYLPALEMIIDIQDVGRQQTIIRLEPARAPAEL